MTAEETTGPAPTDSTVSAPPIIDKLIHEPARLQLMALLYVVDSADMLFLQRQTGLTWGNISSHMSKLEAAGYLEVLKSYKGKKPHTMLKLTREGRQAFEEYREWMRRMLESLQTEH